MKADLFRLILIVVGLTVFGITFFANSVPSEVLVYPQINTLNIKTFYFHYANILWIIFKLVILSFWATIAAINYRNNRKWLGLSFLTLCLFASFYYLGAIENTENDWGTSALIIMALFLAGLVVLIFKTVKTRDWHLWFLPALVILVIAFQGYFVGVAERAHVTYSKISGNLYCYDQDMNQQEKESFCKTLSQGALKFSRGIGSNDARRNYDECKNELDEFSRVSCRERIYNKYSTSESCEVYPFPFKLKAIGGNMGHNDSTEYSFNISYWYPNPKHKYTIFYWDGRSIGPFQLFENFNYSNTSHSENISIPNSATYLQIGIEKEECRGVTDLLWIKDYVDQ